MSPALFIPFPTAASGIGVKTRDACSFLCTAQTGLVSGQNLQLDGESCTGLF